MLSKVEVRTNQGDLLSLTLDDDVTGFVVQAIDGLNPVKAILVSSSFAQFDGAQYQSSRRDTRNILLHIGLDPDPVTDTVRGLRKKLYNFFMPKAEVSLRFIDTDGFVVDIKGRVESLESSFFVMEPAVIISLICFDPDFYNPVPVDLTGMTTADTIPTTVAYDGTVETGIVFTLNVNRSLSAFTIYHQPPNDDMKTLDFASPLVTGDVLTISTVSGNKGATLNRAGALIPILYGISPQSNWIELEQGINTLRVHAEGAGVPLTIEYFNKYGGL